MHATQSIEVIKPLPLVSGDGWTWKTRYTGVVENSAFSVASSLYIMTYLRCEESGIILTAENTLVDPKGTVYAKLFVRNFSLTYIPIFPLMRGTRPVFILQSRGKGNWREILQVYRWSPSGEANPERSKGRLGSRGADNTRASDHLPSKWRL